MTNTTTEPEAKIDFTVSVGIHDTDVSAAFLNAILDPSGDQAGP